MKNGLRIGGHPLHVMLVHFPMALWPASFLCDLIWYFGGGDFWRQMAYWCLAAGLVASVPVALTGMVDYICIQNHEQAERVALKHLTAMICALVFFTISFFLRESPFKPGTSKSVIPLVLSAMGLLPLMLGAYFGGELILRHKIGLIDEHPNAPSSPDAGKPQP